MKIDFWAAALAFLLAFVFIAMGRAKKNYQEARIDYSQVADFKTAASLKKRLAYLPQFLLKFSLFFLLLAFINPHIYLPRQGHETLKLSDPIEGRLLMLALDQSGSMNEPSAARIAKIDFMKPILAKFVRERTQDLIGLSSFARVVKIVSPPTADHTAVIKAIENLKTVTGTDRDGTGIGYAILKTANMLAGLKEQAASMGSQAPYLIKGSAIILATDGLQDPNPLDKDNAYRSIGVEEAATFAKQKAIRLYIINLEPKFASAQYLPNLREMQRAAETTGGKFYHLTRSSDFHSFIRDIDTLESSQIKEVANPSQSPSQFQLISFYPWLVGSALLFFLLGILLKETYFRSAL